MGAVTGRDGRESGSEGKMKEQGNSREEEGRYIRDDEAGSSDWQVWKGKR